MAETGSRHTPSMTEAITEAIRAGVLEIHTAIPAEIVAYDAATSYAKIKLHFKRKFKGVDEAVAVPVISGVPVVLPRTTSAHLRLPIAKGDTGLAIFAERSMDAWVQRAMDHDPSDPRTHAYSDAVFLPGIFDQTNEILGNARGDSTEMRNRSGFVEILFNGKLKIGNNRAELISLLDELIGVLQSLTVTVSGGSSSGVHPITPSVAAQIAVISQRLGEIKGA